MKVSKMFSNYTKDFLIFICNVLILILINSSTIILDTLKIGGTYVEVTSIVAVILFIIILCLKGNERLSLLLDVKRIDMSRLFSLLVYNFLKISLILSFIFMNQISLTMGIILIYFEFILILIHMIISAKNISFVDGKNILKIREYLFNILIIDLILSNMPAELYSIPLDSIIIATFAGITIYSIYLLTEMLRHEL